MAHKTDLERNIADLADVEAGMYWSPKEGKSTIRILPAWTAKGDHAGKFFLKGALHYGFKSGGQNRAWPCLEMFALNCPTCAFVAVLFEEGSETSTTVAKRLRKQWKYWVNMIARTKEGTENSVKVYGMKKKMMRTLRGYMQDPDYGDVTDPQEGRDIVIEREGTGLNTSYELRIKPKVTPVGVEGWDEKLHKLHKVVVEKMTEDQMQKELKASFGKLYTKAMGLTETKVEKPTEDEEDDEDEKKPAKTDKKAEKPKAKPAEDEEDEEEDED